MHCFSCWKGRILDDQQAGDETMLIECWQTEVLIGGGGHMTQQRSDRRERTWLAKATHTHRDKDHGQQEADAQNS